MDDIDYDGNDVQEAFERENEGELEPTSVENENHGENAIVDDHGDVMDDLSDETQDVVENMDVEDDSATGSHPDSLTIRVPLDDRHGGMVSDIQDAGVSVEQQFAQDREFMMGVEQRIHGLFQQLKYSDGGPK